MNIDLTEIREYLKWPDRLTDTGARHIRILIAEVKRLRAELQGQRDARLDAETATMRAVCLAAVQWKIADDAVNAFDKASETSMKAILDASSLEAAMEIDDRRTCLVDIRLEACTRFWATVEALGWHNQERNRPCPKS